MTQEEALVKIKELETYIKSLTQKPINIDLVDVSDHIGYPLHFGKYPVTQAQWQRIMGDNPSYFKGNDLPVEQVSWNDVQEFIRKLNKVTNSNFRLPTDYEWLICSNNHQEINDDIGWHYNNSNNSTQTVGTKKPNNLGLFDMLGNVWEWTDSKLHKNYIIRGGGWGNDPQYCRVAYRSSYAPSNGCNALGFRLVKD